jgi:hypothetical protein
MVQISLFASPCRLAASAHTNRCATNLNMELENPGVNMVKLSQAHHAQRHAYIYCFSMHGILQSNDLVETPICNQIGQVYLILSSNPWPCKVQDRNVHFLCSSARRCRTSRQAEAVQTLQECSRSWRVHVERFEAWDCNLTYNFLPLQYEELLQNRYCNQAHQQSG